MKKAATLISMLALLLPILSVQAQSKLKIGVKGGLNVTELKFSDDLFDASNRVGWFIGPTLKVQLPLVGLGLDLSGLYDQRELEVDGYDMKQQSINVPLNLRYTVGLGDLLGFYVSAGPQVSFNVGDDEFEWTTNYTDLKTETRNKFQLKKSQFSVNFNGGVYIGSHLEVSGSYNLAIGNTADISYKMVKDALVEEYESDTKHSAWQVGVTYYF